MKQAHLYRLRVKFNTLLEWDLYILAANTHAVNMWITDKQDSDTFYITHVEINLLTLNYQRVKDTFCARALTG